MPKIIYVDASGARHAIEAHTGQSVMEVAVKNGVSGIVGECGGVCACGTCKVNVDPHWQSSTGKRSQAENETLAFYDLEGSGLRLSCQIQVSEELDGLIVHTPESQY